MEHVNSQIQKSIIITPEASELILRKTVKTATTIEKSSMKNTKTVTHSVR